jgi:hypothetical protein
MIAVAIAALLAPACLSAAQPQTGAECPPDVLPAVQRVGGWQPIANPNSSADLRPVAKAVLAKIPRRKPRLAQVEEAQSQVVAGTNYRLRLRLKDGTRWSATVWRKLDGTYEVSEVRQVR